MNFKRTAIGLVLLLSVTACTYVPAGNVGIKVNMLGGDKGVDSEVVGPGKYWLGINEQMYIFPTFMQNYVWTKDPAEGSPNDESISFQTVDGMTANADIGISYTLNPDKVSNIFQTYRRGVDEITDTFLRNMVRDALVNEASNKPIEYVYGAGKAELIDAVQVDVAAQVEPIGIKIDKIYWIGDIRLPQTVIDSINAKNAATQMAQQRQNEVAQAKAEADKKIEDARGVAESILKVAEAQAKANKILSESLTVEFVQYEALQKWNGVLPTSVLSDLVTPMLNIKN